MLQIFYSIIYSHNKRNEIKNNKKKLTDKDTFRALIKFNR